MRTGRGPAALVVAGVVLALAFMPAGGRTGSGRRTAPTPAAGSGWDGTVTVLGDGSTSDTGPQPAQPPVEKLKPGEHPPQFVVFSFDGAGDDRVRAAAHRNGAQVTFFLRGLDLLPTAKGSIYQPPRHPAGSSAVPLPGEDAVRAGLQQLGQDWLDGDEIASAFNGQFCGPDGDRDWTTAEWESEMDQATSFVRFWKTGTGFTDLTPLPFDDQVEVVGGRAACLAGAARQNLLAAEADFGWRYDASGTADTPRWPSRAGGLWDFLQQSGTRASYLTAFEQVYRGSRAPLFVDGSHLPEVADVMAGICHQQAVRCVTYRQLADWLDAQDPAVLERLRALTPSGR